MKATKPEQDSPPGDLDALQSRLWDALEAAHRLLKSRKTETRLRAVHAVAQVATAYKNTLDLSEVLEDLAELKAEIGGLQ